MAARNGMNKHLQYLRYVIRHKWFVFLECLRFGLIWQGIVHDWHKFLPDEWLPYVDYFYGDYPDYKDVGIYHRSNFGYRWTKEWVKDRFDVAWNLHQKRGKHHWQHWVMFMDSDQVNGEPIALEMPDKYRLEMVADWAGAGRAITGIRNPVGWYALVKDATILHPETRRLFEQEIDYRRDPEKQWQPEPL